MQLLARSTLQKFFANLNPVVAIDFGSQRIRLWSQDRSIDEPSVVAIDTQRKVVVAVGDAAAEISQRLSPRVKIIHPMQGGEIVEPELAAELLKILMARIATHQLFSPTVVTSFRALASPGQIELYTDLLYKLGAKEVVGVAQPLAAAIGAGVPVADSSGALVAVIGAGVSEAAVVALGSMVACVTKVNTLTNLAQAVIQVLANQKRILISQETAESLIQNLASIRHDVNRDIRVTTKQQSLLVMGKSVQTGAPEEVEITAADLTPAFQNWLAKVDQVLMELLQNLPPELTVDVVTKGLLLSGGAVQLAGLELYLVKKLGIPVAMVDEPAQAVIKGLKMICENLDLYKQSLAYEVSD